MKKMQPVHKIFVSWESQKNLRTSEKRRVKRPPKQLLLPNHSALLLICHLRIWN